MGYLLLLPVAILVLFFIAFITASILDYIQHRKDSKDLFKVLSKDHNEHKRPAAK